MLAVLGNFLNLKLLETRLYVYLSLRHVKNKFYQAPNVYPSIMAQIKRSVTKQLN